MGKLNLEPETKCDFYIDTNRKKVWQAELDILEKVIDVCDKNNIKYFLASGTLLGAVRHKGFIPWDDDIDLVMKREDYNRFLEIAEKSIKYPYFLQCYKTEKNYMRGHAQIRNSETTAIIRGDTKFKNSWFEGEVEVDFEYLKLKAPRGYHEFLTSQYGDYMKLPENKNGSAHGSVFFDTEKSYKEYENRIEEIVKEL